MEETPGLSEQYRKASPWPLFIALGVPISEIGLVFDIFPVAVVACCCSVAVSPGCSRSQATLQRRGTHWV